MQHMVLNLPRSRARIIMFVVPWVWGWKFCDASACNRRTRSRVRVARFYSNGSHPKPRTYMDSFVHGKLYRKLITTLLNLWIAILSQFFARACNRTVERSVRLSPALGKELVVAMYSWTNSPMEQKAVSQRCFKRCHPLFA